MRKRVVVVIVAVSLLLSSFITGFSLGKERDDVYKELDIFAEALALINKKYVDEKKPEDMIYGAMKGLLAALDSYSQFLTPDEYKELLVETEGQFGGIGIEITVKDGLLTVVSPIEDTPAWDAGVKAGDIIAKINGEETKDTSLNEAVKKLRGEAGTEVTITVLREGEHAPIDIKLVRGIIKIKDIKRAEILEDDIGYVRITEFRENTAKDLDKALEELKKKNLKGLIIDVRNNPGGLLFSAIEVASHFLDDGMVVVSTKSRTEGERVYRSLPAATRCADIPMAVLVNKGSASASEILASSLRDNNKAVLVGETTFGKGSVQTIIPLSDNSALRLTTSKYFTPNGESIHEKGVKPDIEIIPEKIKGKDGEEKEESEAIEPNKEFDYKKDQQIVRALDMIKGLKVFSLGKEAKKGKKSK